MGDRAAKRDSQAITTQVVPPAESHSSGLRGRWRGRYGRVWHNQYSPILSLHRNKGTANAQPISSVDRATRPTLWGDVTGGLSQHTPTYAGDQQETSTYVAFTSSLAGTGGMVEAMTIVACAGHRCGSVCCARRVAWVMRGFIDCRRALRCCQRIRVVCVRRGCEAGAMSGGERRDAGGRI